MLVNVKGRVQALRHVVRARTKEKGDLSGKRYLFQLKDGLIASDGMRMHGAKIKLPDMGAIKPVYIPSQSVPLMEYDGVEDNGTVKERLLKLIETLQGQEPQVVFHVSVGYLRDALAEMDGAATIVVHGPSSPIELIGKTKEGTSVYDILMPRHPWNDWPKWIPSDEEENK